MYFYPVFDGHKNKQYVSIIPFGPFSKHRSYLQRIAVHISWCSASCPACKHQLWRGKGSCRSSQGWFPCPNTQRNGSTSTWVMLKVPGLMLTHTEMKMLQGINNYDRKVLILFWMLLFSSLIWYIDPRWFTWMQLRHPTSATLFDQVMNCLSEFGFYSVYVGDGRTEMMLEMDSTLCSGRSQTSSKNDHESWQEQRTKTTTTTKTRTKTAKQQQQPQQHVAWCNNVYSIL